VLDLDDVDSWDNDLWQEQMLQAFQGPILTEHKMRKLIKEAEQIHAQLEGSGVAVAKPAFLPSEAERDEMEKQAAEKVAAAEAALTVAHQANLDTVQTAHQAEKAQLITAHDAEQKKMRSDQEAAIASLMESQAATTLSEPNTPPP